MKTRPTTAVAVLAILVLFVILGLAVTAGAQELPGVARSRYYIYLPWVMMPPPNYALQFDGIDDFASIADKGDFDFDQAFTLEAWVKVPYVNSTFTGLVVGTRSEPPIPYGADQWGLYVDERAWPRAIIPRVIIGPTVVFYACCFGDQTFDVDFGPSALRSNRWQHYAGTYSGGEFSSYLNGELIYRASRNMDIRSVTHVLLGMKEEPFLGLIDEVRVWNTARTQAQIQANMNRTLTGNEPGLVGYWRLDDGSGQAIQDSSLRGNDGRLGSTAAPESNDPTWVVSDAPVQ
jgi:hypothetical protein